MYLWLSLLGRSRKTPGKTENTLDWKWRSWSWWPGTQAVFAVEAPRGQQPHFQQEE